MTPDRYIKTLLALLLITVAAALASCSDGGDEPVAARNFHIGLELTVGDAPASRASRAPSADEDKYHPGSGYENFIDLENGNVRVVVYDTNGRLLHEMEEFDIIPVETYQSSKRYRLEGTVAADISSGNFKILVIANWPSFPPVLSLENLWLQQYDFDVTKSPSPENLIPLYGIKDLSVGELMPDQKIDAGTIHLLRAVAKIEVIYEDPTDSWTLTKLQLTRYNKKGFCAPTGITSQDQYVHDSWINDYIGKPFIPESPGTSENLDFVEVGKNRYMLYVPEYANLLGDGSLRPDEERARLHVDFRESILGDRYSEIRNDGVPGKPVVDILRNNWYKITIKKINEQTDVTIEVDVIPYQITDLEPDFGIIPKTPDTSNPGIQN